VTGTLSPRRILVVGPAWVGDMVMAQSLFIHLKRAAADVHLDVLAPAWTEPLLARMPQVDAAITMPLGHGQFGWGVRRRLGRQLRGAGYQWAIVLPRSWKSALVPWWAGVSRRTGYLGEQRWGLLNDIRPLDRSRLPMTVQRFVALGQDKGEELPPPVVSPRLQVSASAVEAACARHALDVSGPILILCPGAEYGPAKRWPPRCFAEVARIFLARDWQVWLLGSEKDAAIAAEIETLCAAPRLHNLAGRTSLAEAVDLMSLAALVISNDSGLMHVAAALDRPLVAVYGSSDPHFTPPLNDRSRVVRLGLECSPCFQRECPLGHLRCLGELRPERVLTAAQALLSL